jgi:NRPS condensation-like uncharacterized protein
MSQPKKTWFKLDNAAKIYPAAQSRTWNAVFRLAATLTEKVDPIQLQQALEIVVPRFPSLALHLRRGFFWHYLERLDGAPPVEQDVANPCMRIGMTDGNPFMFRVRYHECRIAVEFFHVLTDGTGGMTFLKTLVAEYLRIRHALTIPRTIDILDCNANPNPEELEDSFQKYARKETIPVDEASSYRLRGTPSEPNSLHIITGLMNSDQVYARAKHYGATITEYLVAAFVLAIHSVQKTEVIKSRRRREVKICTPVNLRRFYHSTTLRNFSSFINPGIDPRLGEYTFPEAVSRVKHIMGLYASEKMINARMSTNVVAEKNVLLRFAPLFLKTLSLKYMHWWRGDRVSSSTLSNLGVVSLPPEMRDYVTRFDFMLGPLLFNPLACACATYNGLLCLQFTRTIEETDVERHFFQFLVKEGIHVTIESNRKE